MVEPNDYFREQEIRDPKDKTKSIKIKYTVKEDKVILEDGSEQGSTIKPGDTELKTPYDALIQKWKDDPENPANKAAEPEEAELVEEKLEEPKAEETKEEPKAETLDDMFEDVKEEPKAEEKKEEKPTFAPKDQYEIKDGKFCIYYEANGQKQAIDEETIGKLKAGKIKPKGKDVDEAKKLGAELEQKYQRIKKLYEGDQAREAVEKSPTSENLNKYAEWKAEHDKEQAQKKTKDDLNNSIEAILAEIGQVAVAEPKAVAPIVETYGKTKKALDDYAKSGAKEMAEEAWYNAILGLWQVGQADATKAKVDAVAGKVADITTALKDHLPIKRADKAEDIFKFYGAGGWTKGKAGVKASTLWDTYKKYVQGKVKQ